MLESIKQNNKTILFAIFISFITLLIYLPALQNGFVNWDDGLYVSENVHIRTLDIRFLSWVFTDFYAYNYHPLTWISHGIDYALWGLNPIGHHLTNILLHALNTFLVFLIITRLLQIVQTFDNAKGFFTSKGLSTAGIISSLLFGLHPIHVESVAWISERKDVLYAFFSLLSTFTYIQYASAVTNIKKHTFMSIFFNKRYLVTLSLFICSLLSKPMAIVLPLLLLILDWYPLKRFNKGNLGLLIIEKIPFILFSLVASILTIRAQQVEVPLVSFAEVPMLPRVLIGIKALIVYLVKLIYPTDLIPLYPYPYDIQKVSLTSLDYLVPCVLVIAITFVCFLSLKRFKIFLAVWGYFLITLLPVLGYLKVGEQAMADRYTYLASIGPFFMFGLLISKVTKQIFSLALWNTLSKTIYISVGVLLFIFMSFATIKQIQIWKSGETLWTKEILSEPTFLLGYLNRGKYYQEMKQYEKAIEDFTQGIRIRTSLKSYLLSSYLELYIQRAFAYVNLGYFEEAIKDSSIAIRILSVDWEPFYARGLAWAGLKRYNEALQDLTYAIMLYPYLSELYYNRASELYYNRASELYYNRANVYTKLKLYQEALCDYTQAIQLSSSPNFDYYNNRGLVYKQLGLYEEALNPSSTVEG